MPLIVLLAFIDWLLATAAGVLLMGSAAEAATGLLLFMVVPDLELIADDSMDVADVVAAPEVDPSVVWRVVSQLAKKSAMPATMVKLYVFIIGMFLIKIL